MVYIEGINQRGEKWFNGSCNFATNFTQRVAAGSTSMVGSTLFADVSRGSSTWDFVFANSKYGGQIN